MLVNKFHESIDTLRYIIAHETQRLPHAVARSDRTFTEHLQTQIQTAHQRLELFEPHAGLIVDIETLLLDLNGYQQHRFLEHQWRFTVDTIGNLNTPQSIIDELALRLELLSLLWSSITNIIQQIKYFRSSDIDSPQLDKHFDSFLNIWHRLWSNFFDWHQQDVAHQLKHIFSELAQLELELMEMN